MVRLIRVGAWSPAQQASRGREEEGGWFMCGWVMSATTHVPLKARTECWRPPGWRCPGTESV